MNFKKGTKTLEKKKTFLNNLALSFSVREKCFYNFKSRLFPIKNLHKIATRQPTSEPAAEPATGPPAEPTKEVASKPATESINQKKSKLKLQQEFMNKIIAYKKRYI